MSIEVCLLFHKLFKLDLPHLYFRFEEMSVVGWQVNVGFFLCNLNLILENVAGIGESSFESKETFLFSGLLYFRFADFLFYFFNQFCYFIHLLLIVI